MSRVAVSGATGLVGTALCQTLGEAGNQVVRLVRTPPEAGEVSLHPIPSDFSVDAVVHLAGKPVATRWTKAGKEAIRSSRVDVSARLCTALAALPVPPKTLICASAIGFYGDCTDEVDETGAPGNGFLGEVAQQWEASTQPARDAGIRVVNLRIGLVLSRNGGALPPMLTPFRLGLGGRIGSGRQGVSWIHLSDLVAAICFLLQTETITGPVNGTAPAPVPQAEFARCLGKAVSRPAFVFTPGFALRLGLGEAADLLLHGQFVRPTVLLDAGFAFLFPTLPEALGQLLKD